MRTDAIAVTVAGTAFGREASAICALSLSTGRLFDLPLVRNARQWQIVLIRRQAGVA